MTDWNELMNQAAFLPDGWKQKKPADKVEPMDELLMYDLLTVNVSVIDPELMPTYAQAGDAGADLRSAIDAVIEPGKRMLIPTGVVLALHEGLVGLIHPRSGLALKHGITVLNAPGTIDSGYRGEIGVILLNTSDEPFDIRRGDRIAQLVIQPYVHASFVDVSKGDLPVTDRGVGGFGSTGVAN